MKKLLFAILLAIALSLPVASSSQAATPNLPAHFRIPHVAGVFGMGVAKKAIVKVHFAPLLWVKNVSYVLTYDANGIPQGISGSFNPNGKSNVSKEFFLGTCSGSVCIKHEKIKNVKIQATFEYTDNTTETKTDNIFVF